MKITVKANDYNSTNEGDLVREIQEAIESGTQEWYYGDDTPTIEEVAAHICTLDEDVIFGEESRLQQVEREVRDFLHPHIISRCGDAWNEGADPEDWISEWFWNNGVLYVSIDSLKDPASIASLEKGLFDY